MTEELVCIEYGDDLAAEGWTVCLECLEAAGDEAEGYRLGGCRGHLSVVK